MSETKYPGGISKEEYEEMLRYYGLGPGGTKSISPSPTPAVLPSPTPLPASTPAERERQRALYLADLVASGALGERKPDELEQLQEAYNKLHNAGVVSGADNKPFNVYQFYQKKGNLYAPIKEAPGTFDPNSVLKQFLARNTTPVITPEEKAWLTQNGVIRNMGVQGEMNTSGVGTAVGNEMTTQGKGGSGYDAITEMARGGGRPQTSADEMVTYGRQASNFNDQDRGDRGPEPRKNIYGDPLPAVDDNLYGTPQAPQPVLTGDLYATPQVAQQMQTPMPPGITKGKDADGDDTYTLKKALLDQVLLNTSKYAIMATQMQAANQQNYGHNNLTLDELAQTKRPNDPSIAIEQLRGTK